MSSTTVHDIQQRLAAEKRRTEKISTDDIAPGGIMPDGMFEEFFTLAVNQTPFLNAIRTLDVSQKKTTIPKLGIGERIRRSQAQGAASAQAEVFTQSVPINCEKSSVMWPIHNDTLRNNPEGEALADKIMDLMARQFAADTQELSIIGDKNASTGDADEDDFRQQNDGFLKLALDDGDGNAMPQYAHQQSGTDQPINNDLFYRLIDELPDKYLSQTRSEPVFITSTSQLHAYYDFLTDNYDAAGFQVLMGDADVNPHGYDIMGVTHWPDDRVMFTDPENLIYALWRDVEMEQLTETDDTGDYDLHSKNYIRTEDDFAIENVEAGVLATNVASPTV